MSAPADVDGNRFAFAARVTKRATQLARGAEPDVFPIAGENVVSTAMRDVRYWDAIEAEKS